MRKTLSALALCAGLISSSAPAWAQSQVSARHLSSEFTLGELLDNPASHAVLERQIPVIARSPQIAQARDQTLRGIAPFAPTVLTPAKLAAIDAELAGTPAAVSSGASVRKGVAAADPRIALQLRTMPLWDGKAPGALGEHWQDQPTLTVVAPDGAVSFGTAVVVAPGGGYVGLASGLEGRQVADWFAAHGVTAFVLTYRLTPYGYHHPTQLHDAQRAIRWVRAHAADYGVDPKRIGMIGFSAGGHLTAMTETLFDAGDPRASDPVDRVSSRPDFAILGYAAIELGSLMPPIAGKDPTPQTLRELRPALNVTHDTPPTLIFQTTTDEVVSARNATTFYDALNAAKVPVELHIFAEGRHGMGLGMTDPALSVWPSLLQTWMEGLGLIGPRVAAGQ